MKKYMSLALAGALAVSAALTVALTLDTAAAVDGNWDTSAPVVLSSDPEEVSLLLPQEEPAIPTAVDPDNPYIIVNDTVLTMEVGARIYDGTTYAPYFPIIKALYPDATATWENGQSVVTAAGLEVRICFSQPYMVVNGRYLYLPDGYKVRNNAIMVPVRTLCAALGGNLSWDPAHCNVVITSGDGPIAWGDQAYDSDALYWMSHIINAESGNQPLVGKIAVGNVVLNRVASPLFPNDICSVIFQSNQFTPAYTGTIYAEPNEESVIAAKLCLDGANTVGNALFFYSTASSNCWAAQNRPYLMTIGGHAFHG